MVKCRAGKDSQIKDARWSMIIADECHLQNKETAAIPKIMMHGYEEDSYLWGISGTLFGQTPRDMMPYVNAMENVEKCRSALARVCGRERALMADSRRPWLYLTIFTNSFAYSSSLQPRSAPRMRLF